MECYNGFCRKDATRFAIHKEKIFIFGYCYRHFDDIMMAPYPDYLILSEKINSLEKAEKYLSMM